MPNEKETTKNLKTGINKAFINDKMSISGWLDDMPYDPNEVLGIRSNFLTKEETVRKMDSADPTLAGLKETIIAAILGQEQIYEADADDKGEREFIMDAFNRVSKLRNKHKDMLSAIFIGNSFTELIIKNDNFNGNIVWTLDEDLGGLIVRPPSKFCYKQKEDGTWQLMMNVFGGFLINECIGLEEPLDMRKFKSMTYNAEFGNPIGRGIYNDIYNYWWVKKEEVKMWSLLGEIVVSPKNIFTPKDKDASFTEEENETLGEFCKNPTAFKSIVLPTHQVEVTTLGSNVKAPGEAYDKFINFCNISMAYRMHGQALALNESSGSQAKESVRMQLFNYLTESYIVSFEEFINDEIIKQLCDFNFVNPAYPRFNIIRPESPDPKPWVESMKGAVELGAKVPRNWFETKLGIPNPKEDESILEIKEKVGAQTFNEFLDGLETHIADYKYLTK